MNNEDFALFVEQVRRINANIRLENMKKKLKFDLWMGDFLCVEFVFELLATRNRCSDEHPGVYYGWKNLLEHIPETEAFEWLVETCAQIDECKLKYKWNDVTKQYVMNTLSG
jgi:hypothetical protein